MRLSCNRVHVQTSADLSLCQANSQVCYEECCKIPYACVYVWPLGSKSAETPKPSAEAAEPCSSTSPAAKELGEDVLKLLVLVP